MYGSPELLAADGEALSLAQMCISDQYSLGLIAYKTLTGKDLFDGNSAAEIIQSRVKFATDRVYRAAKMAKFPTGVLGQVFAKLLNEDSAKRYNNLHEVVRVFHNYTHKNRKTNTTNIVRESYRRCLAKNQTLISDFYDSLFQKLPLVRADFGNLKRQLSMFQMSIDVLIDIDEKQDLLTTLMTNDHHKSYAMDNFDVFINTLLEVIKNNDVDWEKVQLEWQLLREKTIKTIENARNTEGFFELGFY